MLPITMTFTGILLLVQVGLSITTSTYRAKLDIALGDDGNPAMLKAIRAHGNFIEYVPILLIAMGVSESAGAPGWLLVAAGCVMVVSRLSHAANMLGYSGQFTRLFGAGLTTLLMSAFAIYLLGRASGVIA